MFKKIILASALAASAAFADWDSFQVLENHKGQAGIGTTFTKKVDDNLDYSRLTMGASVRYTVIPDLELALSVPYWIFVHFDGEDANINGFAQPSFSVRYHFIPTMNAYARVEIPVGDESLVEKNAWLFNVGVEYYTPINQLLNFGSHIGFSASTKGEHRVAPLSVDASAELNFMVTPQFNPYIGIGTAVPLGAFTDNGYESSYPGKTIDVCPYIGASYTINDIVSFNAQIGLSTAIYTQTNISWDRTDMQLSTSFSAKFNF